jgi:very-short-patch-repair endonuclease
METTHERRIDLIGPRGTRLEPFPQAVLHTSRREFSREDGFPSRTCHSLSVVHAMAWAKTQKQAHFYAYWSIQNGYVTMFELCDTALSNRRSSLMKRALPRVLSLRENVDTVTEHLFVDLISKHGIRGLVYKPEFELEDGTPIHPDFGILIGKRMLAVEIDGIHHQTEEHQAIDAFRMRVLRSYGVETFRASNRELNENPDAVMRALQFRIKRMSRAA